MRVNFPGLLIERHRNGTPRIRVRVEGKRGVRINIPVGPDDPQFAHYYYAARAGEVWQPPSSIRWREKFCTGCVFLLSMYYAARYM